MRAEDIVDLWFGPGPFRDIVENWPEVVRVGVASLRWEASRTFEPQLVELLRRAEDHVRRIENTEYHAEGDAPTICPRLSLLAGYGQEVRERVLNRAGQKARRGLDTAFGH